MNENYLTEIKLKSILESLYPNQVVASQVKFGNKRYDYSIHFKNDEDSLKKLPLKINAYIDDYFATSEEELEISDVLEDGVILFIEYNGHYHYTKNSIVSFEEWTIDWREEEIGIYVLSIPYWIQLDTTMTNFWFNIEKDYSEGYPHGFISKNTYLPEQYCSSGEKRFKKELLELPKDISEKVINSLFIKAGYPENTNKNKISKIGSLDLLKFLVENYKDWGNDLKLMEKKSSDPDKYEKYFNLKLKNILRKNAILATAYAGRYQFDFMEDL